METKKERHHLESARSTTQSIGMNSADSLEMLDPGSESADGERPEWGSQVEFILTCLGTAVGLGSVWRFPYLAFKNGGGAFMVPYLLMMFLLGVPVFFFELCLGQFASLGPLSIWAISPMFKGVGAAMVMTTIVIGLSYHVLLAYIIYFLFASFTSQLPWEDCDQTWNTYKCLTIDQVTNVTYRTEYLRYWNMTEQEIRTPSEEYFYNNVIQMSGSAEEVGGIVWQLALCLLLAWLADFLVLIKGIQTLGKIVYFTTLFPYVMMTVMVVRGFTLDGSVEGVKFYLLPEFSKLADLSVWTDAATQVFYSLSTCTGNLIAMASYNKFKNNVKRDSILIPTVNCATCVYAGFSIFTVLGFMAKLKNTDIDKVAEGGPGLVFVVYPEGLSQMPIAPLWSVLFFLMMLTLGFSSSFSLIESVFVSIMDEFPSTFRANHNREMAFRGSLCIFFYLISLPMVTKGGFYYFTMLDATGGGFPLLICGIFELFVVFGVYGYSNFSEDICLMTGSKPSLFWHICWVFTAPFIILVMIILKAIGQEDFTFNEYVFPGWLMAISWSVLALVVCWIPIMMVAQWFKDGLCDVIRKSASTQPSWGPANPEDRTGKYNVEYLQATDMYTDSASLYSISTTVSKQNMEAKYI